MRRSTLLVVLASVVTALAGCELDKTHSRMIDCETFSGDWDPVKNECVREVYPDRPSVDASTDAARRDAGDAGDADAIGDAGDAGDAADLDAAIDGSDAGDQ